MLPDFLHFPHLPHQLGLLTQLLEKGGIVVMILLVMSLVSLTLILYKGFRFLARGVGRDRGAAQMAQRAHARNINHALTDLPARPGGPVRLVIHALDALNRHVPEARVREDTERMALDILATHRAGLRILESTSQLAPLLGLFGTVIGMISAFQTLQSAGAQADPSALAGGIWVALLTTAVGLAVAMPASLALYWFEGRIEQEQHLMEDALTRVFTAGLQMPPVHEAARKTPVREKRLTMSEDSRNAENADVRKAGDTGGQPCG